MAEGDRQTLVGVLSSPIVAVPWTDPRRSRHKLRTVKSDNDSSEISAGSLLFLGLFVLAAALIMLMA